MTTNRRVFSSTLVAIAAALLAACGASTPRRSAARACGDCHAKTREQATRKFVHEPFKDAKGCDACHKRHGVVGALVLKQDERTLCLSCHLKEKDALKRPKVHGALASEKASCSQCHAPHASEFAHLLKKAGTAA